MPKRKSLTGSKERKRDAMRKRQKRLQSCPDPPLEETLTVDAAAPGSECGSIGLPPTSLKPLARVQASPSEKMHSAPRLSPPRGSRLIVPKDKVASPDSPAWVCTPPRVPESDIWMMSGSAGQAQLIPPKGEEVSRALKKDVRHREENKGNIEENKGNIEENKGSFHQGDPMFGENAGTQCVANSLTALAYHQLKNCEQWQSADMNKILATGDELYSYLQCSSTIASRYLLVSELPQFFECFGRLYEFKANESLPSLINLANVVLDYADFNAHELLEALQIALDDSDGCFVCFGGNTFLIGKSHNNFFTFDSHSRSSAGFQSVNGRSTRVLYESVQDLCNHILSLAKSMGYTEAIECEITGVQCSARQLSLEKEEGINKESQFSDAEKEVNDFANFECTSSSSVQNDDEVEFVGSENHQIRFLPLSSDQKKTHCEILGIPFSVNECENQHQYGQEITVPMSTVLVEPDGNCFFRAISFCLTGKQDYHQTIRLAICNHILENGLLFTPFLRPGVHSVENHISLSGMLRDGIWATEVEILALSHLLRTEIHTYSQNRWVTYSGQMVNSEEIMVSLGGIYLDHVNQSHYNVVTSVTSVTSLQNLLSFTENERKITDRNQKRKRQESVSFENERYKLQMSDESAKERKLCRMNMNVKRYKTNKLHKEEVKERSRQKYKTNLSHREEVKQRSRQKYETNQTHKEEVNQRGRQKYKTNQTHKEEVKQRSRQKYETNQTHKEEVKQRSRQKYETNQTHKEEVKQRSRQKYKTNQAHKEEVKQRGRQKYKTNQTYKEESKQRSRQKYKTNKQHQKKVIAASKARYHSSAETKIKSKKSVQKQRKALHEMLKDIDEVVKSFKDCVRHGPEYVCCCCHRLLFENQVQGCSLDMYENNIKAAHVADLCIDKKYVHSCTSVCAHNCPKSRTWICFTCHRKILTGNVPAEAAFNKLCLEDIPPELNSLNSLEQHLIALHIPFMKVTMLPKGGQQNIHGPVVCVPSNIKKTSSLPLNGNENLLLRVKLKRKLSYKGYYEYQFVNPNHVKTALNYLKENNQWYHDVEINTTWENDNDQNTLFNQPESFDSEEISEEQNNAMQEVATDTCLQPVDIAQEVLDHYFDDVYNLAPGEGQNPVRMLQEEGNEAKTFPYLFPTGKYSWNESRDVRITLSRYFNNRLMNADNRFAKDTNYIFFCQYLSELNQVIEKTQISIRKSVSKLDGGPVTTEMLQNPAVLAKLLRSDEAIRFMQPIRGTPAYWSCAQKDLFAMLRQLGIPTWFCSFSAAEYRWNEILGTIMLHMDDNRNPSDLDWSEKSEILRSNPVTVARMFEHRFHVFQNNVIMSPAKPIGNIVDYFVRVEFQQRGSPHMHCLYWVENAPKLDEDSEETVCDFIDRHVTCALPPEDTDQELRQIVLDVQQHSKGHSKSCRKKGTECRFNFPRPPTESTFISRQLEQNMDDSSNALGSAQAKEILLKVWNEVMDDANACKTTEEIFNNINLSQDLYERAHKVLTSKTTTILKRNPTEMWTNQYNPCLLKSWDANMDIQYVLDPFSCIVYIISYISKSEREMGMLLKQTQIEAAEGNLSAHDTIKRVGSAYLNHREVSAQEAVYRVCNLRMKESSRKVIFIPVGENPTRLSKPLAQIKKNKQVEIGEHDLIADDNDDEEENSMWMTNIVERYENRPELNLFHKMCLAEFCSEYRVLSKSQIPKSKKEGVYELRNGKGFIQKRSRGKPAVIRYPRFHRDNAPEKYYQCLLQLFLPHWNLNQLKPAGFDLYQTFYENGHVKVKPNSDLERVKNIVDSNHAYFSRNEDDIENAQDAFEMFGEPEDAWASLCPESELSRRECLNEKLRTNDQENTESEVTHEIESSNSEDAIFHLRETQTTRKEMLPLLCSLNDKQKLIFYSVHEWCVKKMSGEHVKPMHIFITGGAGTGKSHLIKTIHYEASRLFEKKLPSPNSLSVVLAAFTGTAAFNIGGNTIHHVFSLTKALPLPYQPLKEQSLSGIRTRLEHLQILVIDEVSMVYKRLLYYIHERLVQIKKCKEPFGGVSVIAVGDFYQLPPVKQRKDERLYKENGSYPIDYWLDLFKVVELDEIMRQREDKAFATVLNSLRVRTCEEAISDEALKTLQECIRDGPDDVLHVYSTNQEANEYNLKMLHGSCEELIEVHADDYQKDKTTGKLTLRDKPLVSTRVDGLSASLLLAVNARVMLTRNVSVEDGLVNGAMGYISNFVFKKKQPAHAVEVVEVIFDSSSIGKIQGKTTPKGNIVPIKRVEEELNEKNVKSIVRHQFPLKLSWACTAHKVQGMTAKSVVVNLDRTFSPGQAYVAISRVTSKDGLFIETNDESVLQKKIYADLDVKLALNSMEKYMLDEDRTCNVAEFGNYKTIFLFNIQSLRGHFQEMTCDKRLLKADFVCLTETWLKEHENIQDIEISGFDFHHVTRNQCYDDREDVTTRLKTAKGGGVGVYKKNTNEKILINALECKNIEGLTVEIHEEDIAIIVLYRPSVLPVNNFLDTLQKVVNFYKKRYNNLIIMGDMNEDAKEKGPIQTFLESLGFMQMVQFYTTEGGTILDHVYVTESLKACVHKKSLYFSYHEAIEIHVRTQ
ncbi:uncharacterized protein LOC134259411 [Saccostrea cucullata]|uniref:uncharacterized protein LOC134259411 n=1 Tax=Saccostrea cuccullata TaxID=36930 RepID=UPI002ED5777D